MLTPLPSCVYATFAGPIDQQTLPRIFQNFAGATQRGVRELHLLFQSTGGVVGDGISLYNYIRTLPLDLHIYNTGAVHSIAVLTPPSVSRIPRFEPKFPIWAR